MDTVLFEENVDAAHKLKTDRYAALVGDVSEAGYECSLIPFEIGSRGSITKPNKTRLIFLKKSILVLVKC